MVVEQDKAPTFQQKPKLREDGDLIVFECVVIAYPKPDIKWLFKSEVLTSTRRKKFETRDLGINRFYTALRIESPEDGDSGSYQVIAKNRAGEASGTINVNFQGEEEEEIHKDTKAPTFTKKPSIRQENDGDTLLFECIIEANPTPTISWFRDDVPVVPKDRFKVKQERKGDAYHCALVIDDVEEEDGGKYKVTAKNPAGEGSATINLNFDTEEEEEEEEVGKPVFTGKPVIKQSPDFKSIIFECNLTADPKPTLQWYHNGKPVNHGGRYKYTLNSTKTGYNASLEILQVGSEDGGEYKVVAKNSVGEGFATINLNFEADASKKIPGGKPPRFPKKPAIKQEGDSLCLEVVLEANPFPKVTWFLGNKEVKEGPRHKIKKKETAKDTYVLSLEILEPSPEDGGSYRCNAVNELGESNANIALNLQGEEEKQGPTFTQKPKIIPKEGGKLILMECYVSSKSPLQVTWFHGNKAVKETIRIKSSVVEIKGNEYKVLLEIRDPTANDGGVYKCNIRNDEGEVNANLNLGIEGEKIPEGDAPTFVEKPKIIPEDGGKRIIMECKVKANPQPAITWYLDNAVIKETNRITQTVKKDKDVYVIRLELKNPELTDAGLYKCNVKNVAGESNANLTLNIELAPVIREKPKIVRREKQEKVVIECHVQSNAKPECVWFKENSVVKQDGRHTVQVKQVTKGEYAVMLEIDKPSVNDKGIYKLQAKNEKGEIASEPIRVTLDDKQEEEEEEEEKKQEETKKKKTIAEKKEEVQKKETEKKEIQKKEAEKKEIQKKEAEKKEIQKKEAEKKEIQKKEAEKKEIQKKEAEKKEIQKKEIEKKEVQKKEVEKKEFQKKEVEKKDVRKITEKKEEEKQTDKKVSVQKQEEITKKVTQKQEEKKEVIEKKDERKTLQKQEEKKEIMSKIEKKEVEEEQKAVKRKEEQKVTTQKVTERKDEKTTEKKEVERKDSKAVTQKVDERKDSLTKTEKPGLTKAEPEKEPESKKPAWGDKKAPTEKQVPGEEPKKLGKKAPPKEEPKPGEFEKVVLKKRTGAKPVFLTTLESKTVDIGKSVEFSCEIESKERCTVQWYKNKKLINEPLEYKITFDGKIASMTILKTSVDSSAVYTCEASNRFGTEEITGTLFVNEPGLKIPKLETIERTKATELEPMPIFEEEAQKAKPGEKKIVKKKKKAPSKTGAGAEDQEEAAPSEEARETPEIALDESKSKDQKGRPVTIVKEATPEPQSRRDSLEPSGPGSRRSSGQNLLTFAPPARRGSITLIADEKGVLMDEKGNIKKLRPGEVLEVRQKRRSSTDMRRASVSEIEERIDKPSTPLRKIPEDEECPPTIVDYQENVTAVEGATAYLCVEVEGNPEPEFRFYKGDSEIFEGGRYKVVTDGETNSVYFCIRKAKSTDEGKYKIVAFNKLGEDSVSMSLFVSDESGMDFRAMLKHRQYAKWGRGGEDPDWGLKPTEPERRPSVSDLKKTDVFVKNLLDQHVKEGRDKKVRFEAVFSRSNVKAKWYKNKQEIYMGKRYHITCQGDLHVLEINNPVMDDEARYTIQCSDATSSGYLEVDAPDPVYKFIKKLPGKVEQYTTKEAVMECTCNSSKAPVKWYKGNQQIESSDRYVLDSDTFGHKTLKILDCRLEDAGEYTCKINDNEKTTTKLIITEQMFQFMRPLKSMRVMEKEKVVLECEVDEYDARVKWFKDGKELVKTKDKKIDITQEGRKRRLIIKSAKLTDEGEYTCKTNADTTTAELIVEPSNKFVKKLKDQTGVERDQVVLEVELMDKKAPAEWFKNGEPIKPSDNISIKSLGDGRHQLIINSCGMDDGGEYECRSKELSTSGRLTIAEGEKPPKISTDKTQFTGDANKQFVAEIPFTVPGTKISDIAAKLLKNGKLVKDVEISVRSDKIVLTFKKPPRDASGDYDLCVSNAQGEDKVKLNFNFLDVPQPPQGPLDVTDIFRDRCKLSWKPPLDTGGMPLSHYLVEMQDTAARGGWIDIGTTENCNFDVTGLVNKKEYRFRVRAVNKKGASDPLVCAKPIIAKDPFDEPSKPCNVEITDYDKDMVELKWTKPEKDGGSPITGYIIEYKDKFSKEWTSGPEYPADSMGGKVEGLKEGVQYEFRVRAVNKAGPGEPSDPTKPLILKPRQVKPFIIGDDLKNVIVKKGQVIKYDINIGGEPPPDIKWALNKTELNNTKRIKIEKSAKITSITIKDAERGDSGKISLTLSNTCGTCVGDAEIVVLDKPSMPRGPLQLEDVFADRVTVKWEAPTDSGGSDIEGYVVEKMDLDTGRWVPAGEVGPGDRKFTVEPLTPKKKYNFRVKAKK